MAIPEVQLEIWSHQGSVAQSSTTYQIIRNTLQYSKSAYAGKNFEVFLQGSYGNNTNIYAESDVDIVIRLDTIYGYDISDLSLEQQAIFQQDLRSATDSFAEFKEGVVACLSSAFGIDNVIHGNKAIRIKAGGSRRSADVVVCYQYRHYLQFNGSDDHEFIPGIIFPSMSEGFITNYPKQHSINSTAKHQSTNNKFKPLVRIFKNMRNKLEADALIEKGAAPSYFIEGLLYNVPNSCFWGNYGNIVLNILNWLYETTDMSEFLCVNKQHYLLRDHSSICWPTRNGSNFIKEVIQLWNDW